MNRRVTRGLAVLGCVVAVSATASVIVEANNDGKDNAAPALVASDKGLPSAEVVKYWSDSGNALAPLLLYARQLPNAIKAVRTAKGTASASQIRQAAVMGESFATARDLVGRIAVPANSPAGVGELLQVACQLYRSSALALTELKPAAPGPASLAVAQRATSLQALGDRVFDQVRRVLAIDAVGEGQAPVEYRYPPPVTAVAEVTGLPVAAQSGAQNLDEDLSSARILITRASTGKGDASADTIFQSLRTIATSLETHAVDQGEDILGVRIAIALALLAERAKADNQPTSADSLLMISNDIWNQSRTLSPQPHPAITELGAPSRSRSQVWTGGEFNGNPPALGPGQDIGSGLPGGLPKINPTEILKG